MRGALKLGLAIAGPLAIAVAGFAWYAQNERFITTENAYVRAETIRISTNIDGRVDRVFVADNQWVEAGEVLFTLDARQAQVAAEAAEAEIAAAVAAVEELRADYRESQSRISAARERIRFLKTRYDREQELVEKGVKSKASFDEIEHELNTARDDLTTELRAGERIAAALGGGPDVPEDQHPAYRAAVAKLRRAELDLDYARVTAPKAGRVGRMTLQPGEYVEAGDALFAVVVEDAPWIEANLKEVQLTHLAEGMPARVIVDAYPDLTIQAAVDSIAPATGAEFAILPPQNASGTWVKVVQRVPVRLRLHQPPGGQVLRAGMTASISIDTGREVGLSDVVSSVFADPTPTQ
jgi:membrane fusion protein (multidrug efflux system)